MKIAIIGAMEEEVTLLREKITNKKERTIVGFQFIEGQLFEKDVVLLRSGIGKVNAAMSTTILLQTFKPDYLINTGSAGGLNPELEVGDVVISNEVRHHDVDATIFGYEYGQVPQMPASFKANEKLMDIAEQSAKEIGNHAVVTGLITTGDSFINQPEKAAFIKSKFGNLQAVEMEAAAIAQVAHQYNIPFVIIRSLSDIAGKESHLSFDQYLEIAAVHSANLVIGIVERI
ncbi:MAG: 5'-methylthioadenosine/S-adenosylhomocysteine nucleosidase [Niallia sp.]|nr:5''-methylthioadenosine/S-adenosylhomocysteine nucleosidase [Mycobacteroides abscessus subsp. abscessus]HEO8419812.1 5'-methylthioadenosine/S-adenosylhomocysteine nucleosidase [Yersinia enterocolitica]